MEDGIEPARVARRGEHDARDHRAQDGHGLAVVVVALEGGLQVLDLAPVDRGKVGVHVDDGGVAGVGHLPFEFRLAGLEFAQAVLEAGGIGAVFDRAHEGIEFLLHVFELFRGRLAGGVLFLARAFGLRLEGGDEVLDHLGGEQALLEPGEHPGLDGLARDGEAVRTGALGAPGGADVAILGGDGVAAAAHPADQQAAEQIMAAVCAVERVAGVVAGDLELQGLLARLHTVPQGVVDDAQVGNLDHFVLLGRIGPGHALAGTGVLDVGAAVPDEPADVEVVVEDAGAAGDLAADGGVAPGAAARAGHPLVVQAVRDRPRALAVGIERKDPPDDLGLARVDGALTLAVGGVAVGQAAGGLARLNATELAAAGFVAQLGELHLAHRAEQTDVHRGDGADVDGMQRDAVEGELVVQPRDVREPPAEPVQVLDDDDVEAPRPGVRQQLLVARTPIAGAAERGVGIRPSHRKAALLGIPAADFLLVRDRARALHVRAVPGVDDRTHLPS